MLDIKEFHDVLLHDMADADPPHVAVNDLSALRLDLPAVIMSGMTQYMYILWKLIRLDLARHVANYHLELAQLWRCPVSWFTIWKDTPQDCVDHIRLAPAVPATVKVANL